TREPHHRGLAAALLGPARGTYMAKEELIELVGIVNEVLRNAVFRVTLDNGCAVMAHASGKMRLRRIRLLGEGPPRPAAEGAAPGVPAAAVAAEPPDDIPVVTPCSSCLGAVTIRSGRRT